MRGFFNADRSCQSGTSHPHQHRTSPQTGWGRSRKIVESSGGKTTRTNPADPPAEFLSLWNLCKAPRFPQAERLIPQPCQTNMSCQTDDPDVFPQIPQPLLRLFDLV